jgi:hypothetical protein
LASDGGSWNQIAAHLPDVLSACAVVVRSFTVFGGGARISRDAYGNVSDRSVGLVENSMEVRVVAPTD